MPTIELSDIEAAQERIQDHVVQTPFTQSITLSQIYGCELFLKFENLQFTSSFKERGALNKLLCLDAPSLDLSGVATASAGNHAQGLAYHATRLGLRADIFMPKWTPRVKVDNTASLGGNVILEGEDFDDSYQAALVHAAQHDLTLVHPFDDPLVIAGQGTIGLEMLGVCPDLDLVIVPVGGGGLASGVSTALKGKNPDIKVFGVQSAAYPAVYNLLNGRPAPEGAPTIAEGIAVKAPGDLTSQIIREKVDDVFVVAEWEIEDALNQLLMVEKTLVEGAGAAALSLVQSKPDLFRNKKVGLVLSGGNIDQRLLSSSLMRGMARSKTLIRLGIIIRDLPGVLSCITERVSSTMANIIDVSHQRHFVDSSLREAEIVLTLETFGDEHNAQILQVLAEDGFRASILEPAKLLSVS